MLVPQADWTGRPLVGILNNPAVPGIVEAAGPVVEYVEVIPDRVWFDFGPGERGGRFQKAHATIETLREQARTRTIVGHGIGLSLPSAIPLDEEMVAEIASLNEELGFAWYSEHLSMFLTPNSSVPNAQAGLGLPVVYDEDTYRIVRDKLSRLHDALGCPVLMENPTIFTPISDMDMTEAEFLNRLWMEERVGTLLDLHNLYANWRNGGLDPRDYIRQINPEAVFEMHLAGGDELDGFYTDSHSRVTPQEVWEYAYEFAAGFHNLRGITFEFHESYFPRIGLDGVLRELGLLHDLAEHIQLSNNASQHAG